VGVCGGEGGWGGGGGEGLVVRCGRMCGVDGSCVVGWGGEGGWELGELFGLS